MERSTVVRLGQGLCLAGAAFGVAGSIGWATGITWLTVLIPGQPAMMPNTAVACFLVGIAGALRRDGDAKKAARALSLAATVAVLIIGVGTLTEYAAGIDLGLDQLLVSGLPGPYPGRPSPLTALALTFLGFALFLFDVRADSSNRPSDWFSLSAWIIAFTALLGQLFGTAELYRLPSSPVVGVAVPTALSLFLVSVGLLFERPDSGLMRDVTSPGPGGVMLRRLGLTSIVSPAVLGFLTIRLLPALGFRELPLTIAILAASITVVGLALLNVVAHRLNRSHETLEKLRMQTSTLFEQASDGVFVADLDGRYTDVNVAGCRMLGHTREEILSKTILDLIPAGDVDRLAREKALMEQGSVVVTEWSLRKKDGSHLPVEISAKILPDGRWQGIVRDISERKRLEKRLRIAEATSSGIISASADAIIIIDRDQRITLFNHGAEKIFGYTKSEMIDAPLDTLIPERFRARHRKHIEEFAAAGESSRRMGERGAVIFGLRRNGQEFPADAAISNIEVEGRSVLTVALRDMTELKQIQDEQRFLADVGLIIATTLDYEDTLSRIAEAVVRDRADYCIVDIIGGDGELRRLRVASRDPSKGWIGDLLMRLRPRGEPPPVVQSALTVRRSVLVERVPPEVLESLATSDEQLRALRAAEPRSVLVVPLLAHDEPLGVLTLMSTTPERVFGRRDVDLAEELARRAALSIENGRLYLEAQSAIRARDEVMGVVAHDLRNPLNTIVMQSSLLRNGAAESADGSRKGAEIIERAASRMDHLIQDLLDVTRIEAGRLSIERTGVSAAQIVAEAVEAQRPQAEEAGIDLRSERDRHLPDVWADRDRLLQVFENLIGNALKFTPANGRITVGGTRHGGEVLFRVSDTGKGIAAADIPHLFDRFWQAGEGEAGAGLGLSIVKGIVEAHEGRVWAESEPGAGSTFFFTIPTVKAARTDGVRDAAGPLAGRAGPRSVHPPQRAGSTGHDRAPVEP